MPEHVVTIYRPDGWEIAVGPFAGDDSKEAAEIWAREKQKEYRERGGGAYSVLAFYAPDDVDDGRR